ncbi:MAG: ComF family protein [Bacillota bacterium]
MGTKTTISLRQNYQNLIKGFETLLFPPGQNCPLCKQKLSQGGLICDSCQSRLELWQQAKKCAYCGHLAAADEDRCYSCQRTAPVFKLARAVAPYEGYFSQAIKRFKYQNEQWLAEPLGKMMARLIKSEPLYHDIDLIISIPLSKKRLAERGFNQSLLLAKVVGQQLDIPLGKDVLLKIRETEDQIGLTKNERLRNLEGAFQLKEGATVKGAGILLVDDIFTTGSTVHHGSLVLLGAGAREVKVVTWAGVIS